MKLKKKKKWLVTCEVDMDASCTEKLIVTATNEHLANKKAEEKCRKMGHFYAFALSCLPIEE